jgi:hypothetical protein
MGNVIPLSQKVQYSAERRLGAQEQRYETDFFLQRQTMHVAVQQCMLGMSVVLVHDRGSLSDLRLKSPCSSLGLPLHRFYPTSG